MMISQDTRIAEVSDSLLGALHAEINLADLSILSADKLVALAQEVEAVNRFIGAAQIKIAGEIDARSSRDKESSLAESYGCKNATELLQRLTLSSAKTVSSRLRLAKSIAPKTALTGELLPAEFEAVADGLAGGLLNVETAEQIVRDLSKLPPHVSTADRRIAETCLVAAATGAPMPGDAQGTWGIPEHADSVRIMTSVWVQTLDQDGIEPVDEQKIIESRFLNIGKTKDGLVPITARVLPEIAALMGRVIDAVNSPKRSLNEGVRFVPTGQEAIADKELDDRTAPQRRHDAMASILQLAAKSKETPNLAGAPVTVLVEVSKKTLEEKRGLGLLHGHDGEIAPISVTAINHMGCSGAIQKIATSDTGRIIALGSAERVFNAHQRRAITLRDGGCVIPGCNTPATWCEIHHVQEHSQNGATHTDNGVTLCWYHHRSLETSGWQVEMRAGTPWVRPPKWLDYERKWRRTKNTAKTPIQITAKLL